MDIPKSAGILVLDGLGRILLVEQGGKYVCPPKGTVEEHESLMTTASRELREETGYVKQDKPKQISFVVDCEAETIVRSCSHSGKLKRITYFMGGVPNLSDCDWSGERDPLITNVFFKPYSEIKYLVAQKKMAKEDCVAIMTLLRRYQANKNKRKERSMLN
jgi:8-oxo-dGTP pyrophosphatase MutT (NUDIX family)